MHFFKSLIVGASALAALVAAQDDLKFTKAPQNAQAGQSYPITWTGGDSTKPVTILLREGPSTNLQTVSTITSSATGGSYTWKIPDNTPVGSTYALEIQQGTAAPNYWPVGNIAGGSASASVSSAASSAASSASSAASSVASSASSKLSSVASSLSSKLSSATASSTSASVTGSSSSRNSTTVSRPTLSSTRSSSHASSSSSPSSTGGSSSSSAGAAAPSQSAPGAAAGLKSNAALVLGAVAAMAYLG